MKGSTSRKIRRSGSSRIWKRVPVPATTTNSIKVLMRQQQIGQGEVTKWKHEVEERGDDTIFFLEYH
jgi:hypothetical protein